MSTELARDIGRLEAKVDLLLEQSAKISENHEKIHDRVSKLEHGVTASKTAVGIIAGAVGTASGVAVALAEKLFR